MKFEIKLLGGLYIYYYLVCPRKLWFYSRKITMEHESELVEIGKYIELFYKEEKKKDRKVIIDWTISPDIVEKRKDFILVFEIKKSSLFRKAAEWQLKYYLYYLKKYKDINAKGKLVIPEEDKENFIELTEEDEEEIEKIIKEIEKIIRRDEPPRVVKRKYCKRCSYRLLCWRDEY